MFADRVERLISYHDTWIALDPLRGCPYRCVYCVCRHYGGTGVRPKRIVSPKDCVQKLLDYPLYVRGRTAIAIGNETDIFHPANIDYVIELLSEMAEARIDNPIVLITKSPLSEKVMNSVRSIGALLILLFLSYSGLGKRFEPNFTDSQLRRNFLVAKDCGFRVVHYWRPLLPDNTTPAAVQRMLSFVSSVADATVFTGLKLHPELTDVITQDGVLTVPTRLRTERGEWLDAGTIDLIYAEAAHICPNYPLYRHTSCALACVLRKSNYTGTVYRKDICPPSHCPANQRLICEAARHIPTEAEIINALSILGLKMGFERQPDRVILNGEVTQEEFAFLLQRLSCPLQAESVRMQNLYDGSIYDGQRKIY
jgi:hypothetical protein